MPLYELDGVGPDLAGKPLSNMRCWVAPCATVVGHVRLEENASVWFGAVLRGDNEAIVIGKGSNVQDLAVMHTDPGFPLAVGENCTIGHRAIIHGCTIGDNTLIGMGATVMNGAIIGKNCLVGAGALISEGKTIPDGSLVLGAPGKVVRQLEASDIGFITAAAENYANRSRRYFSGLKLLA